MENRIRERNPVIDVLKGIGILSMVMGHCNMGSLFETYIAGFHMQLFFILSGFLYDPQRYPGFKKYVKRKLTTIIVPYFFFAAVTIAVCEIVNLVQQEAVYTWGQYLTGMLWSNRSIFPITGAIWFLQCTFWIEIGYYWIAKIRSVWKSSLLVGALLCISALLSVLGIRLPLAIDSAISGVVFYHIGFLISTHKDKLTAPCFLRPGVIVWLVVFIGNAGLILLNGGVNPRTCEFSILPLYYINALLGTWVWYIFSQFLAERGNRVLAACRKLMQSVGRNSIVYLGFNQLIILGLYTGLSLVLPVEIGAVRAGRNILTCMITLAACGILSKGMSASRLCFLIGKRYSRKDKK